MPSASVFRWIDGRGWLVLAPGSPRDSDIRAQVVARASADGVLACALVKGDSPDGDQMLEDLEELGAPTGYVVDLVSEDDDTIESKLRDASIIVIEGDADAQTTRSTLFGAAERGIRAALEHGAIILAEGTSAVFAGQWVQAADEAGFSGLGWVENALILPTTTDLSARVKDVLREQPDAYAVGIGTGTALALGPDGQVEVWGNRQIAVTLGQNYSAQQ